MSNGPLVVAVHRVAGEPLKPGVRFVDELFQEHPPQALLGPRIAREHGALDDLGQVSQGEDRAVEIREVAGEDSGSGGRDIGFRSPLITCAARLTRTNNRIPRYTVHLYC